MPSHLVFPILVYGWQKMSGIAKQQYRLKYEAPRGFARNQLFSELTVILEGRTKQSEEVASHMKSL